MDYNVQEPWKTVIELSTKLKELGDSSASWEKAADTLSSSDLLDRQEMKDLVVNNHLLRFNDIMNQRTGRIIKHIS